MELEWLWLYILLSGGSCLGGGWHHCDICGDPWHRAVHSAGSTRNLSFPLVDSCPMAYQIQGTTECPLLAGISAEPGCGVCTPTDQTNTSKGLERISPLLGLSTESLQQHPLHLKGNFVAFCKLTSHNQWVLDASYPQLFKEERFLRCVFSLEECKPKSASFLTCFFQLETKVKKWESEKTCSVPTETWNKTLRITLK